MTGDTYRKRVRGSVRFDPYFKVQYWLDRELAWQDVQERHATPAAARAAYLPGRRCRTMVITPAGRRPLPAASA